jgi:hypothetical protein
VDNLKVRDHFGNLVGDVTKVMKWILEEQVVRVWTELIESG